MPYAYVYAPVSGTITGLDQYCSCVGSTKPHPRCCCDQLCRDQWYNPVDIGTHRQTPSIWLYFSIGIRSIRTFIRYLCCDGCSGQQHDYSRTVIVELYAEPNAVCYIGAVKFGHVAFPQVQDGQIYNFSGATSIKIGYVVGGDYPPNCKNEGKECCYTGPHVHMERSGGERVAPPCCATVSEGTTPIYRWYYQTPC